MFQVFTAFSHGFKQDLILFFFQISCATATDKHSCSPTPTTARRAR
jgi:hypothetical protein